MDKDRVGGVGKKIFGSIKEAAGKITGNRKTEAEGASDRMTGIGQNAFGGARDTVRDALKK